MILDNLDKVLSCIIKHKTQDLIQNIKAIQDKINDVDEVTIPYEIIIKGILDSHSLTLRRRDIDLSFNRETLDSLMHSRYRDDIPKMKSTKRTMSIYGKALNLDIMADRDEFIGMCYTETRILFKKLNEDEVVEADGYVFIEALKDDLLYSKTYTTLDSLSEDFNKRVPVKDVILKALGQFSELNNISLGTAKKQNILDIEYQREKSKTDLQQQKICSFGIEGYEVPIHNGTIVVLIADEGVGKTNLSISAVGSALEEGLSVLYFRGESKEQKIRNAVLANYINKKYNKKFGWSDITENMSNKDKQLVETCRIEMAEMNSKLFIEHIATLELFEETINTYVQTEGVNFVVLDHLGRIDSLDPRLSNNEKISKLSDKQVVLKDQGTAFLNLSHTSFDASRGRSGGVRIGAGSGAVTKDADEVFYMHTTEELKRQHITILEPRKLREFSTVKEIHIKQDFGSRFARVDTTDVDKDYTPY